MADLTEPGDEDAGLPAKLPAQRRPSKPVKVPDAEREKVIAELQRHCGDGLLTLDEFAERAGMVWAAATSMDLDAIVADLPAAPPQQQAVAVPMVGETRRKKARRWIVAVMSGANPKGRWRVGEKMNVVCVMGGAEIDLREALFDGPELHISVVCVMGGASVIVPEGIEVDLDVFSFMGGSDSKLAHVPLIPGAPRVRITGICFMGGMDVKSRRSVAELAAERNAKREADREKRALRKAERAELQAEMRGRHRDPEMLGRAPRPPRVPPLPGGRNLGREIRRTIHESILESVEGTLDGLNANTPRRELKDRWETTDDDAAAVRRRLKRNGRPEGTVTIMFTDIEGSTELTERLGDESASVLLKEHNELVRAQVAAHGGYEVKFRGDGFMLAFTSAARGVRCAIAIQQEMQAFGNRHTDITMRVRVGINAGEAVPDGGDFLGTAVNIAARLTDSANGGEVIVTSVVRDLVASSGEFQFDPEQQIALKGISDPQRACFVTW